jgi:osmotically-inducible protein OsmY
MIKSEVAGDGYTAQDESHQRIEREVERRLHHSSYRTLRDVSCRAEGVVVVLQGRLSSHYLKQLAQMLAADVEGVSCVVNSIVVTVPAPRPARPHDNP